MTIDLPSQRRRELLIGAAVGGAPLTLAGQSALAQSPRTGRGAALQRNLPFDADWRFFLGDTPDAKAAEFDDSACRRLDLPHD